MAEDKILTLGEVADHLKLTQRTLYGGTQNRRLPGFEFWTSQRFQMRDIEARIEAQKAEVRREGGRR